MDPSIVDSARRPPRNRRASLSLKEAAELELPRPGATAEPTEDARAQSKEDDPREEDEPPQERHGAAQTQDDGSGEDRREFTFRPAQTPAHEGSHGRQPDRQGARAKRQDEGAEQSR